MATKKDLSVEFCGVTFENPFCLSSSPVDDSYEKCSRAFEYGWAGVFYKSFAKFKGIDVSPRFDSIGKESTPWTGFKNLEVQSDKTLEENLDILARLKKHYPEKVLAVSIMGTSDDEWTELAAAVEQAGADIIECNFSCPHMHVKGMGMDVGQDDNMVQEYTKAVRKGTRLPVIAKMTPNIGHMELPALAAMESGATGISCINTIRSMMQLDIDNCTPKPTVNGLGSIGGYSGSAIKPIALRFLTNLRQYPALANIPISGIGGIETWRDAVEFLMCGAETLQVTTAVMQYGSRIVKDLISGLSYFMEEKGYDHVRDFIGLALPHIVTTDKLPRDYEIIPQWNQDKCIGCGRCYVSCRDAAHAAIDWDADQRRPHINEDKCVGCHLCLNVCPSKDCLLPGQIRFKEGAESREIIHQVKYE
jgi:dihydropyrimidine dehydrogenase (NAD+) subunit PreA